MERTRIQAFKELRVLLSEVLASAVEDDEVPDAFKSASNWERLIAQTENRLADGWRQRFAGQKLDRRQAPRPLFLLPDEEHEQQLLSERFVNDVSYQARTTLDQLDRQLAALSGDDGDARSDNPLGPTAWAEGIRGGMQLINCTPEERDWLMERLMPLLTSRIGLFYSALNNRLTSAGVVARPARQMSVGASPRLEEYRPDVVASQSAPLPTGGGEDAAQGEAAPASDGSDALDRLFGLLSARRGGADAGLLTSPDCGGAPGYPPMPGYQPAPGSAGPAGYPLPPGYAPAPGQAFPGGYPGGAVYPPGFAPAPGLSPPAAVAPWSQGDIFSILSLLQHSYATGEAGVAGAGGVASMGRLQEAMSSTASQLGLSGAIQAMPAPAHDLLELVSMLFEALLDGRRLDEKARAQLARLIIPYVRVAMLDRRMFMQSSHPARRVLNQLVEAFETAAPEVTHYRPLRELAFNTVERIVGEFADDLKLFDSLEAMLATEIDACRRRAELAEKRAADSQAGKERRLVARVSVAGFLRQAIADKALPSALLEFLTGHWQHHQNIVLLREGEAGESVSLNRGLLRDLLRCSDKGEISDTDALRARLAVVFASSGQGRDAADEFLSELTGELAAMQGRERGAAETADAGTAVVVVRSETIAEIVPEPVAEQAETVVEDLYLVPAAPAAALPLEAVERYRQMPIGTWLDFVGEDGRVSSAHISWTSPISGRRILSNRRGQRILVASPEELAEMEQDGRIRPRQSESAFDQAMHTIANKLEASLSAGAA